MDKRIEEILTESDVIDEQETETQSLVRLKDELENKKNLREKVTAILTELEKDQRKSINTTDKDCVSMHSTHGSYAGYNAQIATDEKNGLIASADVVSTSSDQGLLSSQIQHSTDTLEKQCKTAVSDAGYSDLDDISKNDESIDVLVPIQRQNDEKFVYDKASDTYTCPEGNLLQRYTTDNKDQRHRYKLCDPKKCRQCRQFGE